MTSPRDVFEGRLAALRGRRVTSVGYWDLQHEVPEPPSWDHGDWHHAVMGVELGTDQGPVTVTWTSTFHPYGVEVFLEPVEPHVGVGEGGSVRVGPDGTGPWDRLLGSPITGTACWWEPMTIGSARSVDVPVAVRLDLAGRAVWFVAGIPDPVDPRRVFVPGDEIMVVFSARRMREIGFEKDF